MRDLKTGTLRAKHTIAAVGNGCCECYIGETNALRVCLQYNVRKQAPHRASTRYRTCLFVRGARCAFLQCIANCLYHLVYIHTVAENASTKPPEPSSMECIRCSLHLFSATSPVQKQISKWSRKSKNKSQSPIALRAHTTVPTIKENNAQHLRYIQGKMNRFASAFSASGIPTRYFRCRSRRFLPHIRNIIMEGTKDPLRRNASNCFVCFKSLNSNTSQHALAEPNCEGFSFRVLVDQTQK